MNQGVSTSIGIVLLPVSFFLSQHMYYWNLADKPRTPSIQALEAAPPSAAARTPAPGPAAPPRIPSRRQAPTVSTGAVRTYMHVNSCRMDVDTIAIILVVLVGCGWLPRAGRTSSERAGHSVGCALIRAADFSVTSAQMPRPYRQALLKRIRRGPARVEDTTRREWAGAACAACYKKSCSAATATSRRARPCREPELALPIGTAIGGGSLSREDPPEGFCIRPQQTL